VCVSRRRLVRDAVCRKSWKGRTRCLILAPATDPEYGHDPEDDARPFAPAPFGLILRGLDQLAEGRLDAGELGGRQDRPAKKGSAVRSTRSATFSRTSLRRRADLRIAWTMFSWRF
jgi:hypothetical protein